MLEMLLKMYIIFSGCEMNNAVKCLNSVFLYTLCLLILAHCGSEHILIHVGNGFLANWIVGN